MHLFLLMLFASSFQLALAQNNDFNPSQYQTNKEVVCKSGAVVSAHSLVNPASDIITVTKNASMPLQGQSYHLANLAVI